MKQQERKKERKKDRMFTFLPKEWDFVLGKKRTRTTCFHTRAVLCVGHFGSAVTILDKRVVSWRAKMEMGFFLPVSQHAWRRVLVRRQAADGEVRCDVG